MIAALLGWTGTIGTLAAYILVNRGNLLITSRWYTGINAVGGLLGGTASAIYGAWPSVAANFVWAVVGLRALLAGLDGNLFSSRAIGRRGLGRADDGPSEADDILVQMPASRRDSTVGTADNLHVEGVRTA